MKPRSGPRSPSSQTSSPNRTSALRQGGRCGGDCGNGIIRDLPHAPHWRKALILVIAICARRSQLRAFSILAERRDGRNFAGCRLWPVAIAPRIVFFIVFSLFLRG